jgi:hypothetical protein
METAARFLIGAVDAVVRPAAAWPAHWLLGAIALVVAVPTLLVFARLTDQERLRVTKNRIKASILELWLFRDDVGIVLRAQARLFGLNARYVGLTLPAMLVVAPPMIVLLGALAPWYETRPLRPGEAAIVAVQPADPAALEREVRLSASGGVVVETPPLRIPTATEIDWRVRAVAPGVHTLSVEIDGQRVDKQVIASAAPGRVTPARTTSALWQALTGPAEPPLPSGSALERIEVRYPATGGAVWGMPWWLFFFAAMMVFVFALRRPLRVEL